ncbi:hypothetical protein HY375_02880 [Candidatus Berkelbacteria bacterium]|nr:hypothetical protein [Candidatus Berkelbacteria bacterium]
MYRLRMVWGVLIEATVTNSEGRTAQFRISGKVASGQLSTLSFAAENPLVALLLSEELKLRGSEPHPACRKIVLVPEHNAVDVTLQFKDDQFDVRPAILRLCRTVLRTLGEITEATVLSATPSTPEYVDDEGNVIDSTSLWQQYATAWLPAPTTP